MIAVELPSDPANNLPTVILLHYRKHLSSIISKTINGLILCLSQLYPSRLRINITCGSINSSTLLIPDVDTNGLGQKSNTDMWTSKVVAPIGNAFGGDYTVPLFTTVRPIFFHTIRLLFRSIDVVDEGAPDS